METENKPTKPSLLRVSKNGMGPAIVWSHPDLLHSQLWLPWAIQRRQRQLTEKPTHTQRSMLRMAETPLTVLSAVRVGTAILCFPGSSSLHVPVFPTLCLVSVKLSTLPSFL